MIFNTFIVIYLHMYYPIFSFSFVRVWRAWCHIAWDYFSFSYTIPTYYYVCDPSCGGRP